MSFCVLSAGVPRGDTPGEGDGEGGPDGERGGTGGTGGGPGGVGGRPTSAGAAAGVSGSVTGVGRGDSPATGTGVGPGGATPKPPKGAIFCHLNEHSIQYAPLCIKLPILPLDMTNIQYVTPIY